jgi:hypothetical protein
VIFREIAQGNILREKIRRDEMNLQDALKENRKVTLPIYDDNYYVSEAGPNLRLWNSTEKTTVRELYVSELLSNDWLPYPEEKEIRPEKAGELWRHDATTDYFHTDNAYDGGGSLALVGYMGVRSVDASIVHGKHWTRLCPPVEDESVSVRKVIIEDVEFRDVNGATVVWNSGSYDVGLLDKLFCSKMILEIPKDSK